MASALKGTGKKLGGAFVQIRASLGPLRAGLAAAKSIVRTSVRGITKLAVLPITVSLKAVKGAMSAVVGIVKSAMRRVRQLMLMAGIGGGAFVWGFARFEKAMKQATAVSDTTEEQFKQMSEMARGQAMRLNKSASELAQGFYFLGSAGLAATDQIAAFPAVATLAKAAVIEMGAATEMVVDTMKGFQIGFDKTTHVTDVMAKAVTSSNMTFAQLGTSLSYVSGVAKMANNTLEETTAAIAQMADVGIKGSRAGVYMRTGLLRLMAPQAAARKELEKFGVSIYTAEGKMKPFVQIVGELGEALRGATEEQRNMAFKALFGQRAITGQIAVFRKGRAELEKFTDMLRNAGGTAQEIADKQLDNLSAQFGRLIKIVMDTAYAIGKALGPALREAVADLQAQFKKLNKFFKEHELVIAKYALKGYRYFKAFGSGVIDIVKDIAQNWDERWAFMVKAVRIQVKAARDIIATTFDDVWATLKDGAIVYGKTLYDVLAKVFSDLAANAVPLLSRALDKSTDWIAKYRTELANLRKEFFATQPLSKTMPIRGKDLAELKNEARRLASAYVSEQDKAGTYKEAHPDRESSIKWAEVREKAAQRAAEAYQIAKTRMARVLADIVEIEKKAASEIGKAMPEAWKNSWADLRAELKEIDSDIEWWYKKQKKLASDATSEIDGLAKAREGLDAGLGGKLTSETETKEEKTVSFVGIKDMWKRMVESIYSPETKMLSKQADLLADIDTGQGDIVDAVQDVEAAVKGAFAGGAETVAPTPSTQPPTRADSRRERRRAKGEAREERITGGLVRRRERRVEKESPETTIKKEDTRIRREIIERKETREDVAVIERHKREYPDWKPAELPKPATVEVEEIQAPALDKLQVEAPEITAPEIGPIQVEGPGDVSVDVPQMAPVTIDAPQIAPVGIEAPELPAVGVDMPDTPTVGVDVPKVGPIGIDTPQIDIEAPRAVAVDAPEIAPISIEKPARVGLDVPDMPPVGIQAPDVPPIGLDVPKVEPLGVTVPELGLDAPKIDTPKIEPPKIEIKAPKIDVPKINVPLIKAPDIEVQRIEIPKAEAVQVPKPVYPMEHRRVEQQPQNRAAGGDTRGFAALLKEARTTVDELRRINTSVKKLSPIGATAP